MKTQRISDILEWSKGKHGNTAEVRNGDRQPASLNVSESKIILNAIFVLANKIEDLTYGEVQQNEAIDAALSEAAWWLELQEPAVQQKDDSWQMIHDDCESAVCRFICSQDLDKFRKEEKQFYGRSIALIMKQMRSSYEEAAWLYDRIYDEYYEENSRTPDLYPYIEKWIEEEQAS